MKEIRALVADDELPARGELTYELSNIPGVKVIGECGNGREVLAFLKTHPNVDILFLDIEMPLMNGLECAKEIVRMDLSVKVVFATGYSQFAVKAFDLEAFDYILKPYDEARIARTISRLADSLALMEKERAPGEIVSTSQKISLQTQGKTIMISPAQEIILISPAQEIILISSEKSDRALFYTTRGIIESKMTLRDIESLLSPLGFFRTHKGYIVNLSMIHEIQNQDNGTLLLTLSHYPKEKVPVSRHYIKDFKNTLHLV